MTEPVLWLRGEIAGIGPVRDDLVEHYWRWEQELPTIVGYNRQTPQVVENTREIYTTAYAHSTDRQIKFTIYRLGPQEPVPVGTATLYLDLGCATGEYNVAIGEASARGKGVGTEATRLILDYAFHVTGLYCVHLTVLEPNTGAIKAYERAGFKRQGLRRNSNRWLGQKVNEVLMDAIPEDWEGPSLVKEQFQQ